ncbi:hypothetical protein FHR99_003087 [Litorivivens lipolytica]|uniref:Uncharacterized protein n=1 Tax=Litorivivens lipolytica TaxID=1524264 RepID=A0A7W4Z711_9GAMM|nr:hypothetical protein [Litorivivens lipolytica]
MTVFRVEKGEPSVTLGAYLAVCDALDLVLSAGERESQAEPVLPLTILVSNYPQLQKLAWQIQPTEQLSPAEVFSIYERNWRHVDAESIIPEEQALIDALQAVFGDFNVSA